jgi:hypothetical protein
MTSSRADAVVGATWNCGICSSQIGGSFLPADERCNQREDEGDREHHQNRNNDGRRREALETAQQHSRLHDPFLNHGAHMTGWFRERSDGAHSQAMMAVTTGVDSCDQRLDEGDMVGAETCAVPSVSRIPSIAWRYRAPPAASCRTRGGAVFHPARNRAQATASAHRGDGVVRAGGLDS